MTLDDLLTMIVMIVIVSEACIVDAVDFAQRRWRSDDGRKARVQVWGNEACMKWCAMIVEIPTLMRN